MDQREATISSVPAKRSSTEVRLSFLVSFHVPVLIWFAVCILQGIYPFGSRSIMTGDITYQFIDYLSYFKSVITGNNDFTYTFSKTMGGDMAGFSSYYLFSPFNLLLLPFSRRLLPLGLLLLIIIKTGLMALFFQIMLVKMFGYRRESVVFSITYALMGYVVVYFQLYAYFDDLMLLPLIALGILRMVKDPAKRLLYIVTLTLSIMVNFYMGWMLCLFSCLFFLYTWFCEKGEKKAFLSFMISSVISGGLSACVVIPSLLSLRDEKNSFHVGFYANFHMRDLFSRFYLNSFKGDISGCLPNLYCGLLIVMLVWLYFFNKRIEKREKLASGLFLLFLLVNLYINTLNVVWHGLNRPIGFPYRYSFLLTFMMLFLAYKGLGRLEPGDLLKPLIILTGIFGVYSGYLLFYGRNVLNRRDLFLNGVVFALLLLAFGLIWKKKRVLPLVLTAMCLLQVAELSENLLDSMNYFPLEEISNYQSFVDEVGPMFARIQEEDQGFYRMEKYFRRSHNDAMQFGYNGLSHYSSCEKKEVISYMEKLGFRNNGNWSFYENGSTGFVDCLFGIKYLISPFDSTGLDYKLLFATDDELYYAYQNPNALPLMFASKASVTAEPSYNGDPFSFQNQIADSISGKENQIFAPIPNVSENMINLEKSVSGNVVVYTKKNPSEEAYLEYSFEFDREGHAEAYFASTDVQDVTLFHRGEEFGDYMSKYCWNVIDIANTKKGKKEKIKLRVNRDELILSGVYFYYEDHQAEDAWCKEVASQLCTLNKITSSKLSGTANVKEDGRLVFSFPYEDGWKIKIDGQEVEGSRAAGILLSVPVSAGQHIVELKYVPAGRMIGIVISLIVLLVAVADGIYLKKKR